MATKPPPAKRRRRRGGSHVLGTVTHPKRGPRRSRNILCSTVSGPAATCYPFDVQVRGLKKHPANSATQGLGLRVRALRTQSSQTPVALVLVGKTTPPPGVDKATWLALDEVFGWSVTTVNTVPVVPPTLHRFASLLEVSGEMVGQGGQEVGFVLVVVCRMWRRWSYSLFLVLLFVLRFHPLEPSCKNKTKTHMYHCLSKTQSQSIAPEDEITLGLTHRPSDVVDVLYQSR